MKLDKLDHDIIALLKHNSKLPVRDIAKHLNSKHSTIHERIKRLIRDGVIEEFTLKLNHSLLGKGFTVFMFVTGEISRSIKNSENVIELFSVTGEYEYMMKLRFRDVQEFNDFVVNFKRENSSIRKLLTTVATETVKEEF